MYVRLLAQLVVVIVTTFSADSVAHAFIICDRIYGRENLDFQHTASCIVAPWKYVDATEFNLSRSVKNYIVFLNLNGGISEIDNFCYAMYRA
jgi:hypothetical protein